MTLDDLQDKLSKANRLFGGRLPESLKRVGDIYLGLAREREMLGQPIDGIGVCLDMAVKNAVELEQKPVVMRRK